MVTTQARQFLIQPLFKTTFAAALSLLTATGVFSVLLGWSVVSVVCVLCVGELEGLGLRG